MNQNKNNIEIKDELGNSSKPLLANRLSFRAWVDKKYMAYQGTPDLETLQSFMFHYGNEPLLMQSIGLKDKNGIEIYEGDILENNVARWVIEFYKCGYIAVSVASKYTGYVERNTENSTYPSIIIGAEIVGNIYETPKLLSTPTTS